MAFRVRSGSLKLSLRKLTEFRIFEAGVENVRDYLLGISLLHEFKPIAVKGNGDAKKLVVEIIFSVREKSVRDRAAGSRLVGYLIEAIDIEAFGRKVGEYLKGQCRVKLAAFVLYFIYDLGVLVAIEGKLDLDAKRLGRTGISEVGGVRSLEKRTLLGRR